jgi:CRISPR-associated protein Csh2
MKTKAKELKEVEELARRSELLFFYDARMCNPNGDPNENKPRIDEDVHKLLVTEFRLKRTIRKYLSDVMGYNKPGHNILLRQELDEKLEKIEGEQGFKMLDKLAVDYIDEIESKKKTKDGKAIMIPKLRKDEFISDHIDVKLFISDHIDVKLFGLLFAVGKINFKLTGPVQFKMGQTLNDINGEKDIIPISMTSLVPNTAKEGISKGGSFGEKWLVRYAFIQHHGFVNNNVAKDVNLTEKEVKLMLTAMWNGTDELMTTSKLGQKSRLLIKVNYKLDGYIGDLDLMAKLEYNNTEVLENITQVRLNLDDLLGLIEKNKDLIDSIEYEYNPLLQSSHNGKLGDFEELIKEWSKVSEIPVEKIEKVGVEEITEASHV